jgi:hypothetical protein
MPRSGDRTSHLRFDQRAESEERSSWRSNIQILFSGRLFMTVTRWCNGVIGVKYRLTPESSEPRRMIENHGLKSEVLCVSKLDCVKIVNTAEKNSERSRIVVTIQSTACLMVVHSKPTGETTIGNHRSVLTVHISPPLEHL